VAQRQQAEVTAGQEPHTIRVGLLQAAPVFGETDRNLASIAELRDALGPVDLALTPELSATGYGFAPHREADLLDRDDSRLAALAGEGIGVGFAEKSGSGLPWNSYLLADPVTGTRHLQRKLHPVSYPPWNEHLSFQPGAGLHTGEICGATFATVICNDMWHPTVPWLASHAGAEVLIVPVASIEGSDPTGIRRTWQVILEHAALLLQCYVVFVNRCGTDSGATFWGGSRILGPDGSTIASLGDEPGVASAVLDLAELRKLRAEVPILAEDRPDLVAQALSTSAGSKGGR
jgi:predicted amidohydrolase